MIRLLDMRRDRFIRRLHAAPRILERIRPDTVFEHVFPAIAARSQRLSVEVEEHRLDARRPELEPQHRPPGLDCLGCLGCLADLDHSCQHSFRVSKSLLSSLFSVRLHVPAHSVFEHIFMFSEYHGSRILSMIFSFFIRFRFLCSCIDKLIADCFFDSSGRRSLCVCFKKVS